MKKIKRAIKRSSGIVLASTMILNSSGVMTFAQTLELEKTITSIEQSYGINSAKDTTTDTIEEVSTENATVKTESATVETESATVETESATVETESTTGEAEVQQPESTQQAVEVEQVSEQDTDVEAVAQEQQLESDTVETPEIVTANTDTRIGDALRTLLDNGTALTGKVVDDKYQITVKKGQNIGFYSNSDNYNVRISDGEFEYAEYNVTSNVSFGTTWSQDVEKGNYLVVTALNDYTINIPSELKDSVEIKSVTSPALKHNTAEAGKSYEFKLADGWKNNVDIHSNQDERWFEYADYNADGISNDFGENAWSLGQLSRENDKTRKVITSTYQSNVDVTYPNEYDVTAITFTETTTPALKHNTVEAGKSYEFKLADSWENSVDINSNQDESWFEYADYNADGISNDFGENVRYLGRLSKENDKTRKVITSTYESDVDVTYPGEYDKKAITFTETTTPALKHNTVEAGKSYEFKLADSWENSVDIHSNQDESWFEYADYNAEGISNDFDENVWYLGRLSKENDKTRKVITSTYESDVDVTYPGEYDKKAITFTESTTPALNHQTIEVGKSYVLELKEGQTINPIFNADSFDMEYAIYGNDGHCYEYSDNGNWLYDKIDVEEGKTKLVFTSKADANQAITYPYDYGVNVMTFEESKEPALQKYTLKAGKSCELKLVSDKINQFFLKSINNVKYAMYSDDGECNSFGNGSNSSYEFSKESNQTRLVLTSTSDSDTVIFIPYQYNNGITFNETSKPALKTITLLANKNYKITNNGQHKVSSQYSSNFLVDAISGNEEGFKLRGMPDIFSTVYISTYGEDNTITVPTEYGDNLKLEEVDDPIFNRIELKAGETVKLTSKNEQFSTQINMSGDYTSKISTLVMDANQSGKLSSNIGLSPITLNNNKELYIQASSDNATNVLLGVSYKAIKNGDITVEKTDIDLSEANKFENVTKVAVKEAKAVKPNEEKVTYATSLSDYKYTMYNETTKQYIYGYKYNTSGELAFANGSVKDGDVISITLSSDKIDTVTQKFTYKKNGNVELNVSQKGGYSITGANNLYTNAYLFDSEGKVVKSDVTKSDINEASISSGKYQLLIIRDSEEYVNKLTKLSDLELYGLEKDKDYTLTDCEIKSGVISTFDVSKNVELRDGKTLTSFDKSKTKVTSSSDTIIGNDKKTITIDYALNSKFNDWSMNAVVITIPSDMLIVEDSVKVDGSNVKCVYNQSRQLVVNTTNKTGKVTFEYKGINSSITTTQTSTFKIAARLTPKNSSDTVMNTLGQTSIKQYNFLFVTSNIILKNEAQLKGLNTVPNQDVAIFVDGKKVTTVKTDSNGAWNTTVTLPEKKVGESYKIYASLYTGTKNETKTGEREIIYNPISSTVKQFNLLYNSKSYDIINYNSVGSMLNLTPGSTYKFTLGFGSTNVKDVYVIGIKDGVQKKIKATQDANGNWVAEGYFDNDKTFAPDVCNVTFTEEEQKLEVTATASASTVKSGETVKISTSLKNNVGAYTYKFIVYDTTTKQWTKLQDFSSSSSYTWKTTDAGNKQIYVDVKDSKGNVTRSQAVNVKVEETTKPLAISATKKEADKTVTFTANGTGGSGKYSYKFIVYNKTTNSWAKLQDFSDKNTFTWTKGNAGDRYFYVDVKDNTTGKTVRSEALNVKIEETTKPLAISATKKEADKTVTFTANGTGGSGKYSYKFIVYNKTTNSWAKLQDFSSKNTFTWTKGNAGDRYFYVDVKDNTTGKTVRSQALNVKIDATSTPTSTLTASTANVNVGGKVTLTAKATAGSGKYTYKFLIYNPTTKQWAKLQDFSDKSTFTWTAGSAGARQFYVDVKDSNGKVTRSKVVNVQVGNAQSVTKLSVKATASTTANKVGQNVTFTATANGGAGGYTYKFLVYNKTTKQWAKIQDFSATSKLTWKAGSAGERQFYVDVKDKNGNTVRSSVMNVKTTK